LLVRLGLRAGEVASLQLDDIDWRAGTLCVAGKSRRRVRLPLPQDAGDAVLHYLDSRRDFPGHELFVSLRAPIRGISRAAVTDIVARAVERSGIAAPSHGAHMLRHSAATSMLRRGTPLGLIGAVLRHRSPQTTMLYAKVDAALLFSVAQPWPAKEVTPC
jgi:integrase